ncbi:protein of unknown function [Azospirillum baldaniorum]|uniref:Uncharacterized protein n=1 Tax=Azospirillum baldaniorum TaxID=1064539 RepID=A0A9P1JPG8_9PROT|nr:protein of unknown function [Azospirillum baldaniorum]
MIARPSIFSSQIRLNTQFDVFPRLNRNVNLPFALSRQKGKGRLKWATSDAAWPGHLGRPPKPYRGVPFFLRGDLRQGELLCSLFSCGSSRPNCSTINQN